MYNVSFQWIIHVDVLSVTYIFAINFCHTFYTRFVNLSFFPHRSAPYYHTRLAYSSPIWIFLQFLYLLHNSIMYGRIQNLIWTMHRNLLALTGKKKSITAWDLLGTYLKTKSRDPWFSACYNCARQNYTLKATVEPHFNELCCEKPDIIRCISMVPEVFIIMRFHCTRNFILLWYLSNLFFSLVLVIKCIRI